MDAMLTKAAGGGIRSWGLESQTAVRHIMRALRIQPGPSERTKPLTTEAALRLLRILFILKPWGGCREG